METYKVVIDKKELLDALSDYYTNKKNKPIRVKENHSITYSGYQDEKAIAVEIYYEDTIEVLGHKATITKVISAEEIKAIINESLEDKGYTVKDIYYDVGLNTCGYLYDEHPEPYFNGIELSIAEKQRVLSLNR